MRSRIAGRCFATVTAIFRGYHVESGAAKGSKSPPRTRGALSIHRSAAPRLASCSPAMGGKGQAAFLHANGAAGAPMVQECLQALGQKRRAAPSTAAGPDCANVGLAAPGAGVAVPVPL